MHESLMKQCVHLPTLCLFWSQKYFHLLHPGTYPGHVLALGTRERGIIPICLPSCAHVRAALPWKAKPHTGWEAGGWWKPPQAGFNHVSGTQCLVLGGVRKLWTLLGWVPVGSVQHWGTQSLEASRSEDIAYGEVAERCLTAFSCQKDPREWPQSHLTPLKQRCAIKSCLHYSQFAITVIVTVLLLFKIIISPELINIFNT